MRMRISNRTGQARIDQSQIQSRLCSAIILSYKIPLRQRNDNPAPDICGIAPVVPSLTLRSIKAIRQCHAD